MPDPYVAGFTACCGIAILKMEPGTNPLEHKQAIETAVEECYEGSFTKLVFPVKEEEKSNWQKAFKREDIETNFIKTKTGFLIIASIM